MLRGRVVSGVSTVVVIGLIVLAVVSSSGWNDVKELFFNWDVFKETFPDVLRGFWLDVRLFVVIEIAVLIVGLLVALARFSRSPLLFPMRLLAAVYSDVFRGLPTLLIVFLIGFALPALGWGFVPDSVIVLGAIGLGLSYGAYVAEVYRAGIHSVHPSQRAAARALGLSTTQAMRFVVLPQAVRRVVPPLLNDVVSLTKDSGLISVLGAIDAVRAAQIETAKTFDFTPYVVAGALFVLLTIPMTRLTDAVSRRYGYLPAGGHL